ncbi:hypothetical protein [Bradyrhizobium prioriisuperbiae]|uniref:hypothetical protein n=1 Tax=Bradyrhizobium prioriisuperbiae TaxID=2854389 RepID=UPI0028E96082|nr:hypothetical protein [Bradyrhizobium prioritasuperba]
MGGTPLDGLHMRPPEDGGIVGTMRNLTKIFKRLDDAAGVVMDFTRGGRDILDILGDIYRAADVPGPAEGNATNLVGDQLHPLRDRDARRPQPTVGGGLKKPSLKLRLKDTTLSPDFSTLTLFGEAKATLELATDYPSQFDSPTEIALKVTSTSISPSQIGVVGSASVFKVLRSDFKLRLHYDNRQLIDTVVRFAKRRGLSRGDVEQLLQSVSFDASATVKLGLPISFIKLSASSILPLRRPVIGATEELLPIQLAALPDREMFIGGAQVIPKGVFFDVPVPALGLHYSRYGRSAGVSGTIAGLAKPDMSNLGQVQYFGYLDLRYAKRVTSAVDLDVGITYTYSPSAATGANDEQKVGTLHDRESYLAAIAERDAYKQAASKSWQPTTRDNTPPGADRSGHNFMFTIRGTFDALGGGR